MVIARAVRALGGIFGAALLWLVQLSIAPAAAQSPDRIVLTDAAGRTVQLTAPARRLALSEADLILSLAPLLDDPVAVVAGWAGRKRLDPGIVAAFAAKFPAINEIPEVGGSSPGQFSVEGVVAVRPDLYVIRLYDPAWEPVARKLEAAGIPVIYLDGPTLAGAGPDRRVIFAISLLGQATGAQAAAAAYTDFLSQRYDRVRDLVARASARPPVLVDGLATADCCWVPGEGNRLGELVRFAGGEIVGSELIAGYAGKVSAEYLLAAKPQVLIVTGGPQLAASGGFALGVSSTEDAARASLDRLAGEGIRAALLATASGRVHGILHLLTITPLDILAAENFARWIHPELAAQIDPDETLAIINRDFLAVPLDGTLWVDAVSKPATDVAP